jgi:hypothetical protein
MHKPEFITIIVHFSCYVPLTMPIYIAAVILL